MNHLAYSLLLVLCGWHLRGAIGGMWRRVYRPHRFGDGQHLWLEVNGEPAAFTDDQVEVAQVRARRLSDPRRRWWKRLAWVVVMGGLILVCLSGCMVKAPAAKATAKPGETSGLTSAMGSADKATTAADAAADAAAKAAADRDAKVKANAEHAKAANEGNADGPAKVVVDGDLTVILALLDDVTADPAELAARARDALLVEAGKVAEARASYGAAVQDAQAKASALAVAQADAATARTERDAARALEKAAVESLAARLEQNRRDNQLAIAAAIAKAKDEERKAFLRRLGFVLLGLGILGALIAGATMYLTKGTEWERAAIAAGGGASCFALYWCLGQAWFPYLVWSVGAGMVAAVGWYLWRESRQHKAIQEKVVRSEEADEAEDTLKRVIQAVDELGESATIKDVRERMKGLMNDNNKALIHELRAETKRNIAA